MLLLTASKAALYAVRVLVMGGGAWMLPLVNLEPSMLTARLGGA